MGIAGRGAPTVSSCSLTAAVAAVVALLVVASAAHAGGPGANPGVPAGKPPDYVPGEVLVLLSEGPVKGARVAAGDLIRKSGILSRGRMVQRSELSRDCCVLRMALPAGASVEDAIAERWAKRDPRILAVEPNYIVHALGTPDDPQFGALWGLHNNGQTGGLPDADIDAVEAWDTTTGSSDVVVAVIDTGIDYLHPDLAPNMWRNPGESGDGREHNGVDDDGDGLIDDVYGGDFVASDGDPMDEHNHGTHVAGTIGARGNDGFGVAGINWQCKLMACRFLNASGSGTTADAIEAINYAVAHGAQVLNNSWGGGGFSASLEAAIVNARDHGVLFVAAAGNEGANNDSTPHYPSSYDLTNVIAVAATTSSDTLAGFSNYGANTVHLGAPGSGILSTVRGAGGSYDNAYASFSGTSMATPHVSGVAALVLAARPDISLAELRQRLVYTGDLIDALNHQTISGRRLNAYKALIDLTELTVITPRGGETWLAGSTHTIEWFAPGAQAAVTIELLQGGASVAVIAAEVSGDGTFTWQIPDALPPASDYRVRIVADTAAVESEADFSIVPPGEYFTEQFGTGSDDLFDLAGKSLLLTPDAAGDYTACITEITALPTHPAGGTPLAMTDDSYRRVSLSGGGTIPFAGRAYDAFYVGSNGYVTFDAGDRTYRERLSAHFSQRRISALFDDLNPAAGGTVSFKQLADRVVVTWENVPEYARTNENTFQVEMFLDGRLRISWPDVVVLDGLVGLSSDVGVPFDFGPSDVSEGAPCVPNPPVAEMLVGDANGVQQESIAVPISMVVEADSPAVDGITLNFSGSDGELEWVSFTPGDALSGWIITRPFDASDGIVSMQSLGPGLTGAVTLGTLRVRTSDVGSFGVRLSEASGPRTTVSNGVDSADPTLQAGVVAVTCREALGIVEQPGPAQQTICPGGTVTIPITVTGVDVTYQWQKDGVDIAGATEALLQLADVQASDVGSYTCVVQDVCAGPLLSEAAVLAVDAVAGPVIVRHPSPVALTTCSGRDVRLDVLVNGLDVAYQWKKDGEDIPGATAASLVRTAVQLADAGNYSCEVTDACAGPVRSEDAVLTVVEDVTADAGEDQSTMEGNSVTVGGAAPSGTILWTIVSNPGNAGRISDANAANPSFTASTAGTYVLQVTVTDPTGTCTATDQMTVAVAAAPPPDTGGGGGAAPPAPEPEPEPEPDPEPEPEPEPPPEPVPQPVELAPAGTGEDTADDNGNAVLDNGQTVATLHGLLPGTPVSMEVGEGTTLTLGETSDAELTLRFVGAADLEEIAVTADREGNHAVVFVDATGSTIMLNLAGLPVGAVVSVTDQVSSHRTVAVTDPSEAVVGVSIEGGRAAGAVAYSIDYGALTTAREAPRAIERGSTLIAPDAYGTSVTVTASGVPAGAAFIVALRYSDAAVAGIDEGRLRLETLDTQLGSFAPAGVRDAGLRSPTGNLGDYGVDPAPNSAWAVVTRLGTFALGTAETNDSEDENEIVPLPVERTPVCGVGMAPWGIVGIANWLMMFSGLAACRLIHTRRTPRIGRDLNPAADHPHTRGSCSRFRARAHRRGRPPHEPRGA